MIEDMPTAKVTERVPPGDDDERPGPPPREPRAAQPPPAPVSDAPPSPWRRRLLVGLAVALLALVAGWWTLGRGIEVRTAAVTRGDAAAVVYATGNVEPVRWAKVAALQRKRIVEICDCEGQAVKKGEVLARLDDAEERAVLRELEARLTRLQEEAERFQRLVARNVTAPAIYEEKLTQVREQESRVTAQKDRIDNLVLRAPMDGIVLRRDGHVGEVAGTGVNDVLLWVGDPTPLQVAAEVNEEDIFRVRAGQRVLLRHEGTTEAPLSATVASITPKGDPETKTFRVYLGLPADTPLRIGMSVEANIVVAEAQGALLVPAEAVGGSGVNGRPVGADKGRVQVVEGGRARVSAVDIGIRGTRLVEVRSGLEAGDRVVNPYRPDLADGARIRFAEDSAQGASK